MTTKTKELIANAEFRALIANIMEMRDDGVAWDTIDAELGLDAKTANSSYALCKTSAAKHIMELLAA